MGAASLISPEDRARLFADECDLDVGASDDRAFWRELARRTNGPILELGCGGGRLLTTVCDVLADDRELIGVDLDPDALALAAERLPQAVLVRADARWWRSGQPVAAGLVIIGGDLLPLITVVGFALAGIIEGAFFVETLMGINGIGRLTFEAVTSRDYDVILATTVIFASAFVLCNLLAELMYGLVDPRVRLGAAR